MWPSGNDCREQSRAGVLCGGLGDGARIRVEQELYLAPVDAAADRQRRAIARRLATGGEE